VEWHFVDLGRLKKKGRFFICSTCKDHVQNARKCNEESWDVRGLSAQVPIDFLETSTGHNFCPAKLFRDDPEFCLYMQYLYVAWEFKQKPSHCDFDTMDEMLINDLYDMITIWKTTERENNLYRIGSIFCGDSDDKK
jgi:hypothetical protein